MSPCDIRGGFDIGEVCTATSGGFHFDAKGILIVCCFSFVTAGAKEKLTKENAVGCFASAEATTLRALDLRHLLKKVDENDSLGSS